MNYIHFVNVKVRNTSLHAQLRLLHVWRVKCFMFRTTANISLPRSMNDINISWPDLYNEHSQQISLHHLTWATHEAEKAQCATYIWHEFPNKNTPISHETGVWRLEELKHKAVKGFLWGYLMAAVAAKGLLIWMSLIIWQSLRKLSKLTNKWNLVLASRDTVSKFICFVTWIWPSVREWM